ncbi:acyltransferase family protein [Fusobacterium massiliense]|uniref:acyltransferase family protein n=1 Tax=Fusobacterium massiliense TaxID=1852365 RepID=UPI0028E63456|nr:acyltransferase family protein [Fusobacterium massiliense]
MSGIKNKNIGIYLIKAFSLISVIIYHLYEYKGTYMGVVTFFVVSGYLISEVLWEREESYFQFIKRRYVKIIPPLITVLLTSCLVFYYFYKFLSLKLVYNSLTSLFGLSNIYQIISGMSYFERSGDIFPLLHTWSLSIEIQFYLFYPFLIYFFKNQKINEKLVGFILLVFSLVSAFIMFYKTMIGYDLSAIYYGTDTRIFSVFVGASFYFLFKNINLNKKRFNIYSYISLVGIIVSILIVDYSAKANYYGLLYLVSVLSGVITVGSLKVNFLNFNLKFFRIFEKLGEHSYIYYLWQYPIMIFSLEFFKWSDISYGYTVVIQIIILIILSEISYKLLIAERKVAKILRRIFIVGYALILIFLPLSEETNSEEVKNKVEEIDANSSKNKMSEDGVDYLELRLLNSLILPKSNGGLLVENGKYKTNIKENSLQITDIGSEKTLNNIGSEKFIDGKDYVFIGDSVMKMGEPYIKAIFENSYVDAKVSRQFVELPNILKSLKDEKKLRKKVIVHLGTNGVINKKSFDDAMEILGDREIYFINTVVPKPWEKGINKDLEEWTAEYKNVHIIDWHKYAKGDKELFFKDATHPKPEGAKKYAEFILKSIEK